MLATVRRRLRYSLDVLRRLHHGPARECPACGHRGAFRAFGHPPRYDAECPRCSALERHRLLALVQARHRIVAGGDVLHFAPEAPVVRLLKAVPGVRYRSADIAPGRADLQLDIERLALPDQSVDVVVASHVLEHVDDRLALANLHRVLRPGGVFVFMLPVVEGWATTYENARVQTPQERELHFGQNDHVRFYGRDVRDRVQSAGFTLTEYVAEGEDVVRHALLRGETVFVARRG